MNFQVFSLALPLKGLGNLFAMCNSPNELHNMSIISSVGVASTENLVPGFGDRVACDFVEVERRTVSGRIEKQIHASFPLKQADLCTSADPRPIKNSRKEN